MVLLISLRVHLGFEGFVDLAEIRTISRTYKKFCEFGTVHGVPRSGKPEISSERSIDRIEEILVNEPSSLRPRLAQRPAPAKRLFPDTKQDRYEAV